MERDIPQLGPRIPAETLRRFWTMLAHNQGTPINHSKLAQSIGVSGSTISRYLDLLVDLLLVRRLPAWTSNVKKRMTKSPKTYVRDSGLVHALLNISSMDHLLGHPVPGFSWEGFIIENIINQLPFDADYGYYRTSNGAEIDLVVSMSNQIWAIEIKRNSIHKVSRGFHTACDDIQPDRRFLIYPGKEGFNLPKDIEVISLMRFLEIIRR